MKQPDTSSIVGIAAVVVAFICLLNILPDLRPHAQEPPPPAAEAPIARPEHPKTKGRYSVTWQSVGGEVKEPFDLMILKDAVDGHCYLIDGTLTETQVNFGPQVPCE